MDSMLKIGGFLSKYRMGELSPGFLRQYQMRLGLALAKRMDRGRVALEQILE